MPPSVPISVDATVKLVQNQLDGGRKAIQALHLDVKELRTGLANAEAENKSLGKVAQSAQKARDRMSERMAAVEANNNYLSKVVLKGQNAEGTQPTLSHLRTPS